MTSENDSCPASNGRITIREMEIDDIAAVYHLGERLFTRNAFPTLYRTWDSFEVTYYYNSDSDYCLVAENGLGQVIGFALGSTVEKRGSRWKYGYLAWLGVAPEYQGKKVADRLEKEFEKCMKEEGVGILLLDTEEANSRALSFFKKQGFSHPKTHVWLSKRLTREGSEVSKPIKPFTRSKNGSKNHSSHASPSQVVGVN